MMVRLGLADNLLYHQYKAVCNYIYRQELAATFSWDVNSSPAPKLFSQKIHNKSQTDANARHMESK